MPRDRIPSKLHPPKLSRKKLRKASETPAPKPGRSRQSNGGREWTEVPEPANVSEVRKLTTSEMAKLLVDAAQMGDAPAMARHRVHAATLQRARRRLGVSPQLAKRVLFYQSLRDKSWANEIPRSLRLAIEFIGRAAEQADPADPDVIVAISGAIQTLAAVESYRKILEVRLSQARMLAGQPGGLLAPGPSGPAGVNYPNPDGVEVSIDEGDGGSYHAGGDGSGGSAGGMGSKRSEVAGAPDDLGGDFQPEPPRADEYGTSGKWKHGQTPSRAGPLPKG